jgi:hypothetical protein
MADYTVTVVGDTTIAGTNYATLTSTTDPGKINLMRQPGGIYYSADRDNLADERIIFKDLPAGSVWNVDYAAPNGTPNRAEFTLVSLGGTRTVTGTSYTNVAHLHTKNYLQNPFNGEWMLYTESDYYYSKGVGLIESDLGAFGKSTLVSYSIK